ncbi:MAG TPA: helix-turn-helix domain-containing protein [Acidimicrobiales bacterium]|nr:helix-turn-helix domain-containing protein [Acidimicrobiales bacterium]
MDRLLLKPEEAALLLGIGRTKLYELLAIGVIRSVQIGACRRVSRQALEEYVNRLQAEADEDAVS